MNKTKEYEINYEYNPGWKINDCRLSTGSSYKTFNLAMLSAFIRKQLGIDSFGTDDVLVSIDNSTIKSQKEETKHGTSN